MRNRFLRASFLCALFVTGCGSNATPPAQPVQPFSDSPVVYRFSGTGVDGNHPYGSLIALDGKLYGTTAEGGRGCRLGCGTIFEFNPTTKVERVLHLFRGSDGAYPHSTPSALNGLLYVTTLNGGDGCPGAGCGSIFEINPTQRSDRIVYRFLGGNCCGAHPYAGLTAVGGTFYGATYNGGPRCSDSFGVGCGTIFEVHPTQRIERVIYVFKGARGGGDGAHPYATLLSYKGLLWGTTSNGGAACAGSGCGTVFAINPATDQEVKRYDFKGGISDGAHPHGGLIAVGDTLYGTTINGGVNCPTRGCGTVFELNPETLAEHLVFRFDGNDGAYPNASLIKVAGNLYGTTERGGDASCGTVFEVHPAQRSERVVYSFRGSTNATGDGNNPQAELLYFDGKLWGTTSHGGRTPGYGTIFAVTP